MKAVKPEPERDGHRNSGKGLCGLSAWVMGGEGCMAPWTTAEKRGQPSRWTTSYSELIIPARLPLQRTAH